MVINTNVSVLLGVRAVVALLKYTVEVSKRGF